MSQARRCDLCNDFYTENGTIIVGESDSMNTPIDICPKCRLKLGLERTGVGNKIYRRALVILLRKLL